MTNINERQEPSAFERYDRKQGRKTKAKSFMSMVAAGVVGSVLTLTIAPHTDSFETIFTKETAGLTEQSNTSKNIESVQPVQTSPVSATNASLADIIENSSKSIVGIVNMQASNNPFSRNTEAVQAGSGSGVIFKKENDSAYVITNNHVIEGAKEIEVSLYNGDKTTAEVVGADALTDLAVLKIDSSLVNDIIEIGDSSTIRAGDQVLAIGNPLGLDLSRTVTQGIVSATDRSIEVSTSAGEWNLDVIQTDAAINPGNSGGALINTKGQLIGINSLKISESGVEGLGFAIPSNDLLPIVNEMIETGKVTRPYMGIGLANLNEIPEQYLRDLPEEVEGGIMITNVDPNSAASSAGLQVQDVIVAINDQNVKSSSELRKYLYSDFKIGDVIKLDVYRQGELQTIELTLTSKNSA